MRQGGRLFVGSSDEEGDVAMLMYRGTNVKMEVRKLDYKKLRVFCSVDLLLPQIQHVG